MVSEILLFWLLLFFCLFGSMKYGTTNCVVLVLACFWRFLERFVEFRFELFAVFNLFHGKARSHNCPFLYVYVYVNVNLNVYVYVSMSTHMCL